MSHDLKQRWLELLGHPSFTRFEPSATKMQEARMGGYDASLWKQTTGPEQQQTLILLRPHKLSASPAPCAVIPFYHPEDSAGLMPDAEKNGLIFNPDTTSRYGCHRYGQYLAERGFIVLCTEAFPFNTVSNPDGDNSFDWWRTAAEKIRWDHPQWTGLGKLVHDTQCAITLLLQQPDVDITRLLLMGHSLGGKMAFYTGALDERASAVIASDFGLPWDSTNWNDPWYLGEKRPDAASDFNHEKLLALLAPRPFFLISGETDGAASWQMMRNAATYYALHNKAELLTGFDHASGHQPTPEALEAALCWLSKVFDLPK